MNTNYKGNRRFFLFKTLGLGIYHELSFLSGFPKNSEVQSATGRWGTYVALTGDHEGAASLSPIGLDCLLEIQTEKTEL